MARTVAEIQADINKEQNAIGAGNWNSKLNTLVAEKNAASIDTGDTTTTAVKTTASGTETVAGDTTTKSNSWGEWAANLLKPIDGATYVGGQLVYDEGHPKAGQNVPMNADGSFTGTDMAGNAYTWGGMGNDRTNDNDYLEGTYEKYTIKDVAGTIINPIKGLSAGLSYLYRWSEGIDPALDEGSKVTGSIATMWLMVLVQVK